MIHSRSAAKTAITSVCLTLICLYLIHSSLLWQNYSSETTKSDQQKKYFENLNFPIERYRLLSKENYTEKLAFTPIDIVNASVVFNSINNVLDASSGAIQPNGISVFTGYIPQGTLFYHANFGGVNEFPSSPEWVAMNWEYSYAFGIRETIKRPGENFTGFPGHGSPPKSKPKISLTHQTSKFDSQFPFKIENQYASSFFDFPRNEYPSLLTFQNIQPLNKLIVLEGASAKKENDGTMDVQNILANTNSSQFFGPGEVNLVRKICEWGQEKFGGLDGIVRMEVGFEIVLCDFKSDKIRLVSNDTFIKDFELLEFPDPLPLNETQNVQLVLDRRNPDELLLDKIRFNLVKYLGFRKDWDNLIRHYEPETRIKIDYRGFVSPINKTYVTPDPYKRRALNLPEKLKDDFIEDLEKIFAKNSELINYWDGVDWQSYTRHIIKKFYPLLMSVNRTYETYQVDSNLDFIGTNLTIYTYQTYKRYHDHKIKNREVASKDALNHLIWEYTFPNRELQSNGDVLIWASISEVVLSIGKELFSQYEFARKILHFKYVKNDMNHSNCTLESIQAEIQHHQKSVSDLLAMLNWTINYQCDKKCPLDSICFIPTWGPSPFRSLSRDMGKAKDPDGILRIKKSCQCLKLIDIVGYPEFA